VDIQAEPCTDSVAWDDYVAAHPAATSYHRWAWRSVFERAFGHEPIYLWVRSAERVCGVLPLVEMRSWLFGTFAVSLPFVNYGGVLADDHAVARALLDAAVRFRADRGWKHVELRHTDALFPELPAKRHKVVMSLTLPGSEEALWRALDRKVRNQVRKAEKTGCTAGSGGAELLDEFYAVFAHNMRDLGTPVYSRDLFSEVVRAFPDETRLFVVRHGDAPVAASLTIAWRGRIEVPWASSLRMHNDKSPNTLLYWTMLRDAVERGRTTFDFGRSTPNEGTFHFKRQWGADPHGLAWEYVLPEGAELPDQSPKNPKFALAIKAWQHLPLWVANRLGPVIAKQIP
jgi:serine/alanine adding enzyme